MSIGERIMVLRTERQMSQSDLAEALDVSRQSISKWETDSSVPELEKLVMLCEIFGVSMDMLVRGIEERPAEKQKPEKDAEMPREVIHVVKLETRKIIAILLFICAVVCIFIGAFAGDPGAGMLLALPFAACAAICLACRKRAGLWCAWTVYLYCEIFLRFATGISLGLVGAFLRGHVGLGINVIASFIALILIMLLAAGTVWSFRKLDFGLAKKSGLWLAGGWAAYFILRFALGKLMGVLLSKTSMWTASMLYIVVTDWGLFILLVLLLIWTYHWFKNLRKS